MSPWCPRLARMLSANVCMMQHIAHRQRLQGHHLRDETCADCSTGRDAVAAARAGGRQTPPPAESPRPRPAARPVPRRAARAETAPAPVSNAGPIPPEAKRNPVRYAPPAGAPVPVHYLPETADAPAVEAVPLPKKSSAIRYLMLSLAECRGRFRKLGWSMGGKILMLPMRELVEAYNAIVGPKCRAAQNAGSLSRLCRGAGLTVTSRGCVVDGQRQKCVSWNKRVEAMVAGAENGRSAA